jgi:MarR family transcriptional regulator, transcriptional regulator for hemolysin
MRVEPLWHPELRETLEFTLSVLLRRTRSYEFAEHRLLLVLTREGSGLSQQAIADRAGLDRTTASKAARRLEERQQLRRQHKPRDKRKLLLLASPETARAAVRAEETARTAHEKALSRLTAEEQECLQRLLTKAL